MRTILAMFIMILGTCLAPRSVVFAAEISFERVQFQATSVVTDLKESGTLNDVHYEFYRRGGGGIFAGTSVQRGWDDQGNGTNWEVACSKNGMNDKKRCSVCRLTLCVTVHSDGKPVVIVGEGHFPGTSVAIRVDGGVLIRAPASNDGAFSSAVSLKIINQLKTATNITTRYAPWPYREYRDYDMGLFGFPEAFQYINWAVKAGK